MFILLIGSCGDCQIAHHYELLIIEDDPYYFLQFNKVTTVSLMLIFQSLFFTFFNPFSNLIFHCSRNPTMMFLVINVKNEVYKMVIGDVVAHLKPQKFTISSDL